MTSVSDIQSGAQDNNPDVTNKSEQRQPETCFRQRRYDTNNRSRQERQRQTDHFGEIGDRMFYSHNRNFVNKNNRDRQRNTRNNTHNTENHHHDNGHNHNDSPSFDSLSSSELVNFLQSRDVTGSHMSEELQTRTSKRISYLLRHGAHSESVKITP